METGLIKGIVGGILADNNIDQTMMTGKAVRPAYRDVTRISAILVVAHLHQREDHLDQGAHPIGAALPRRLEGLGMTVPETLIEVTGPTGMAAAAEMRIVRIGTTVDIATITNGTEMIGISIRTGITMSGMIAPGLMKDILTGKGTTTMPPVMARTAAIPAPGL